MNLGKAMDILGLSYGYTEIELKKAYRELARKWHPDKFKGKEELEFASEKMKEINGAKDVLSTRLKRVKIISKDANLESYKQGLIERLEKYERNDKNKADRFNDEVEFIVSLFMFNILDCESKLELDNYFNNALKRIKKVFLEYQQEYYLEHFISSEDVFYHIKYNCSLDEFERQLKLIEKVYSRKTKFERKICLEVQNSNKLIEKAVLAARDKAIRSAVFSDYADIDGIINTMHQEIVDAEKQYHEIRERLSLIKEKASSVNNRVINEKIVLVNEHFLKTLAFEEVLMELNQLEDLIEQHINSTHKKIKASEMPQVDALYQRLVNKANAELTRYPFDTQRKQSIRSIIDRLKLTFQKYSLDFITLDVLMQLDGITFNYFVQDNLIIDAIDSMEFIPYDALFVKKPSCYQELFDSSSFYSVVEEDGNYFMIQQGEFEKPRKFEITLDYVLDKFILLDDVLDKSRFVGKENIYQFMFGDMFAVYKASIGKDDIVIYLSDGEFKVGVGFNNEDWRESNDEFTKRLLNDKEYVKDMIIQQFKDKLAQCQTVNMTYSRKVC